MTKHILYEPHDHQAAMSASTARIKVAMMPARSGKGIWAVNDRLKDMADKADVWKDRPDTMVPKWNIWGTSPVNKIGRQMWNDFLAYCPRDLFDGEPRGHDMVAPLIGGARFAVRSADTPDWLVAEGVDSLWVTEAGLYKKGTWGQLRFRLMSPDRMQDSSAAIEGTPQGQYDPDNPNGVNDFWGLVLEGQKPDNPDDIESFYWFEMRGKFGNLEHPLLSLTPEGRAEIEAMRKSPTISDREFRQNVLGECLPAVTGRAMIGNFDPAIYICDFEPSEKYGLYRVWDFGRAYPVVTWHQFTPYGWDALAEFCPILQDMIDVEFTRETLHYHKKIFGDFPDSRVYDIGDHEATHKEDSRLATTQTMMRDEFGIHLVTPTKRPGDEQAAINSIQGYCRPGPNPASRPWLRIHRRATMTQKCFAGMWMFKKVKVADYEQVTDKVLELHPYIDIWDTFKYFAISVVVPNKANSTPLVSPTQHARFDKVTGRRVA